MNDELMVDVALMDITGEEVRLQLAFVPSGCGAKYITITVITVLVGD